MAAADWVIVAVLLLSVLQAARRGIFLEAFSLAGIVLGVALASWNYTRLLPWFVPWLRTPALADAGSFVLIVLAVVILANAIARVLRWSMHSIGLGWADRLLGAGFGLVKGGVLVTLGVMLLVAFWPGSPALRNSKLGPYFAAAARGTALGTPAGLRDRVRYGARLLRQHAPVMLQLQ